MSVTTERRRLSLAEAEAVAAELIGLLAPVCERIEVAGSIRRRKSEVKDIELVLIGRAERIPADLFGEQFYTKDLYGAYCDQLLADGVFGKRLDKNGHATWGYGARYAWYGDVAVDLFGTEPERWGMTMMIRTGPAEWNQRWVTQQGMGGTILPFGMRVSSGWLWSGGRQIETPEEQDVFDAIGVPYREPWNR